MLWFLKSHKGSHIFKNHGFPYYDAMYTLLGKTPIAGANQVGTSTQKARSKQPSLTPEERALDASSDDSGPDEPPRTPGRLDRAEGKSSWFESCSLAS